MSETYTLSYNRLKLPGRTFWLIKPQRRCVIELPHLYLALDLKQNTIGSNFLYVLK